MGRVSWHHVEEDETVDLLQSTSDDDNVTSQRRMSDDNVRSLNLSPRVIQPSSGNKALDETKYKYSLISVLVIGIILIMMVNIGLGYRKCHNNEQQQQQQQAHPSKHVPPSQDLCMDETTGLKFPWQKYRLPDKVEPSSYHIHLHPNFTHENYTGQVEINITIIDTAEFVILHTRGQKILSATLTPAENSPGKQESYKATKTLFCIKNDMVAFHFNKKLKAWDKYSLLIDFNGNLTFSLGGFYLSKYKNQQGKETVIGATQFEPTDARAAFPCFDEPAYKANFSLSMVRERGVHTLFNTPLQSTTPLGGDIERDDFQPTVRMSTYLVAFIVSDFVKISNRTSTGVEVSVYASKDKLDQLNYALHFACKVLTYFENLFKIPFPLPKMDLVAVPDFAAGAMENWGLVTYRETALLYDPMTSSVKDKQWVATVIAHELSHQWFGNLVTMEWWNDLWLNEGFASYMEFAGVNAVEPQWSIMSEFPLRHAMRAFSTDSSNFTHPITVNVTNSKEINEIFDNISYSKGACIIYMLADLLGKVFFQGVNTYLNTYKFDNAENSYLIQKVSIAARKSHPDIDIQAMMKTWTTLPGFPLVDVNLNGNKLSVSQSRFLYPTSDAQVSSSSVWHIPLSYVTDVDPMHPTKVLLDAEHAVFTLPQSVQWVKLNHNQTGYYQVNYDAAMWSQLINALNANPNAFSVSDRSGLISDAFEAARVGKLNYNEVFRLLGFISQEKMYAPIVTAVSGLRYISHILKVQLDEEAHNQLSSFTKTLFENLYDELSWKNRSSFNRNQMKLQTTITSVMCSVKHKPCIDEALLRFKQWKEEEKAIPPDDVPIVFEAASLHGTLEDWQHLWETFINSTDPNLKQKILLGMAQTTRLDKILFLQSEFLKGETIRSQDAQTLVSGLTTNLVGGTITWRFVKQHWEQIVEKISISGFAMRSIIKLCLDLITDHGEVEAARSFFISKGIGEMKSVLRNLENSAVNAYWAKTRLPEVKLWLKDQSRSRRP
uniref:endoplasmic reticulum aminopeptidase 2-like isoform X4 n=1 Tax=Ciona intestinalis TaxID=7719 RepID=UPI000EF4FCEF|nr:endoplasmic reticulum aminopeptidase 2-like isoform X4 [Ciona intestinalis]|eukprot:XP_026693041.1 endoplasmic reticulum aminopeptidase 2-like isoform X4 [Ciona intestinalis]